MYQVKMSILSISSLEDVYDWLKENNVDWVYHYNYPFLDFKFVNLEDSILFKLTWG